MIVNQINNIDNVRPQIRPSSKNLPSIVLDPKNQTQQVMPSIAPNRFTYASPKQSQSSRQRLQLSQGKQNVQKRLNESPDNKNRGRQQQLLMQIQEVRPKTAINKQQSSNQFYSFYVDKGNNSQLVRKILSRRFWLYEATTLSTVNIRWKQTSKDFNYAQLGQNQIGTQRKISINHLEHHPEISTKTKLFLNLKIYGKKVKENINSFVPATYLINLDSNTFQIELKDFIDSFCKIKQENVQRNVWLLKPPDLNRGQGIQIFNDIKLFITQLQDFCKMKSYMKSTQRQVNSKPQMKNVVVTYPADKSDPQKDLNGMITANFILEQNVQTQGSESRVVVLQKYLENPFIYNGRKFDFRVWVLVDHNLQYYFFREGYLRLASETYDISSNSLKNKFVHLTNNAIQKNHDKYGKFELGNQLSFSDLQNYLQLKGQKINVRDKIVSRMKELVKITLNSASDKLAQCSNQFQYELYGYDFMIDNASNIWLIEINTNPCLEESSPLLQKLIPRMLNDAFKLTVDKMFPPQKPDMLEDLSDEYAVPGYNHQDNLWEYLGKITK